MSSQVETADADHCARPVARCRLLIGALLLVTIVSGLASRRFGNWLPEFVATYAGDALWAAMVYWLAAMALPRAQPRRLAAIALGVSLAIEVSQLYHAPWSDAVRATRLGALALGHGFLWSDLVCYAAGVAVTVLIDKRLLPLAKSQSRQGNAKNTDG